MFISTVGMHYVQSYGFFFVEIIYGFHYFYIVYLLKSYFAGIYYELGSKNMASISFKDIKKVYPNGITAVQNFNLEIEDKEFIIFVGPSGCGKSTALRMVAGLEEVSSGAMFIDDQFANELEPIDRDVAMIFQNYALYPHMTVYDNMAYGLKVKKLTSNEIDQRVKEAAEILGIEEFLQWKPDALSGGQRQRVAMGRALVRQPKVLLMDEPLSNLDAKLRQQMRSEIARVHKKLQTTTIYVTHDQVEAMALGSRIVVMKDGHIQQVDTPVNLYLKPKNKFVAGFMGTPSMNFIEAKVININESIGISFGNYEMVLPKNKEKLLLDNGYLNREVIIGIRPEDIHDKQIFIEASPNSVVEATVMETELLGPEAYLYVTVENSDLTAKVDMRSLAETGDNIKLALDLNKIHIFDIETEEVITNLQASRV